MIKTVAIKDNYSVQIVPDSWDKNIKIYLIDEVNDAQTTLATWQEGRWTSDSYMNLNKFFEIINLYPKVKKHLTQTNQTLKTNVYETNLRVWSKTFNCFRRQVRIKIYKALK